MKLVPFGPRVVALMTALLLLCGLAAASSASAAILTGTVSGQAPEGEAIPLPETNVTVTYTEKEAVVGTATVDPKGEYTVELPDGVYDVRFSPPSGYEPTTVSKVEVEGFRVLNVVLKTGKEEEPEEGVDFIAPELLEFGFQPTSIDTSASPQTVVAWAYITDKLTGFLKGTITYRSPSGEQVVSSSNFEQIYGNANSGGYEIPITFPQSSEPGVWTIESVRLYDAYGNEATYATWRLKEIGWQYELTVSNAEPDEEAPNIDWIGVEPTTIDTTGTSRTVTVYAHVTDNLAGAKQISVTYGSPDGNVYYTGHATKPASGTPTAGIYEIPITFQPFSEVGSWSIASIYLSDTEGNQRTLLAGQIEELGLQRQVQVEGATDSQGPTLTELAIEPTSIDTSGESQLVFLRAHFEDDLSGFSHAQVTFTSPSGSQTTSGGKFELVKGSPNSGDYEGFVSFKAFSEPGPWEISQIRLVDATGNETLLDRGQVIEMGFPNTVLVEAPPQVVLSSSPNPSVRGQKVTFTAKVLPPGEGAPLPLGTVAFVEGTSTLGVVNLNKGTATFNTTALGAGEHPIVARYSGDSNYGPSESKAIVQVVEKAETSVTLTSPLEPAPFGSTGSVKASVKAVAPGAGTPAGTVTFREGETVLATVQLAAGGASLPLKSLALGAHAITASYNGDPNYQPSGSEALTQTIVPAATELTLTSSANPGAYGNSGTLKATVDALAPSVATPTGSVTFWEGEEALATVPLAAGTAKYPLKSFSPGSHPIRATFNAPPEFGASEAELTQVVTESPTELTLTSSLFPAPYGSSGTLKATVKAIGGGGGAPSGTVTFYEGEAVLAIVPLSSSIAKYPLKSLSPGVHQIRVVYNGDGNYAPSEGLIELLVVKAETSLTLTSPKNPAPFGSSGSIKATVKAVAPGGGTPTGTVTFSEGEAVLATVPLSSGSATYPLKSLAVGTHEITARYNGNANYEPSEGLIVQTISP